MSKNCSPDRSWPRLILALWCLTALTVCGQQDTPKAAGSADQEFAPAIALTPREDARPRITTTLEYSYVLAAEAEFGDAQGQDSDAHSLLFAAATTFSLDEHWFVPIAISSANHFLGEVDGMPIPEGIHTLRVLAGAGYRFNPKWSLSINAGPVLYKFEDVGGNDVGYSGLLNVVYRPNATLTWAFGVIVNPDGDVPVLPGVGVRWDLSSNLTMNLMFPRPAVIYSHDRRLKFYAGADIRLTTFRAPDDMGVLDGDRFGDELGNYRDIHFGAGVEYAVLPNLWATVEAGGAFWRRIEYDDPDRTVRFDPAPYVQAALRYRF